MLIHQMAPVFREAPSLELVEQLLKAIGLQGTEDFTWFTKKNVNLDKFELCFPELEPYYIPCKAKEYIHSPLTQGRAITIIRQVLKCYGLGLKTAEKSVKGVKTTWYQIIKDLTVKDGEEFIIQFS